MSNAITSTYHDYRRCPWVVELVDFQAKTNEQQQVIGSLNPGVLDRILGIWLQAVTSGARLSESEDRSSRAVIFRKRDDLRAFLRTFGGKKLSNLPTGLSV